jgi:hypothetical protein
VPATAAAQADHRCVPAQNEYSLFPTRVCRCLMASSCFSADDMKHRAELRSYPDHKDAVPAAGKWLGAQSVQIAD